MDFNANLDKATRDFLSKTAAFCREQGVVAYLVGGLIRDALLGRKTADIDIAVDGDALDIAHKAASALTGSYVLLDEANGVARVIIASAEAPGGQWQLDFSTLRGDLQNDLAQRDLTINAMALDIRKWNKAPTPLLDPFKGMLDLEQHIIRSVTDEIFKSDAARLLRAVRLAAELDFKIESHTETLLKRDASLAAGVSGERTREELIRLLAIPQPGLLFYLDKPGLLTTIFPELEQARGVTQPAEHVWNVFEHTLQTVGAVDFLLRKGKCDFASEEVLAAVPWSPQLAEYFEQEVSSGTNRRIMFKMAALLHDIAKPQTKMKDATGRTRFLGHPQDGALVAAEILRRLRFSSKEIRLVELMVHNHLRPTQMSNAGLPTNHAIYRYFRDTEDAGIDILYLSLADHLATRGPTLIARYWQEHAKVVEYLLAQRFREESPVKPAKLIDGHDLVNIIGLNPGPRIGELLEAVREAQASGEVKTREEALAYVRKQLSR